MNRTQAKRYLDLCRELEKYGLTDEEVDALLRCERTLSRWACRECGDGSDWHIEREELPDGREGKPFMVFHGRGAPYRYAIADRETAAINRAQAIAARHGLTAYRQGDPRGCGLYILRPGDIPEGQSVTGYYTRGVAICID